MSMTASDVLIETLIKWGVDTVFGLPGDGINGVMEGLRKRQDQIRFVLGGASSEWAFRCLWRSFPLP